MDPRTSINPFPGLRPFMREEADLFFGRDRQSDALVRRLASKRFLAVVGTSGSGKSSLVRAGLLPSLEGGLMAGAGAHWRMAMMRPQDDPFKFLARAIVETGALAHLTIPMQAAEGVIETTLRRSSLGLIEAVRVARLEPHENLLILVDQFEELFRFADLARQRGSGDEAPAFVKLLLEAVRQTAVPVYVVVTMRSDFLGDCARFRDLPEVISDSQYLIPRLTRDELQAVITGPIGVRSGRIAPGLLQRLLNDVGDDMDQLPVLQHALMRAWDHWEGHAPNARPIDLSDLKAIGGMAKALSHHAEEAFGALTSDQQRTIAQRLFKCLTERGSDNREIRRPTPLARVAAIADVDANDVIRVVEVFRAPGRSFLMPPTDVVLEGDSVIDISHESLIRQWARLRTWVEEEAESRATYLRIVEAARLRGTGRAGLWGEPDLTYARQWVKREAPNTAWAERYGPGFDEACAFLRDSEAAHTVELKQQRLRAEAERMAKERELEQARALAGAQRQRADEQAASSARQRRLSWALSFLLALAVGSALYGLQQRRVAEENGKLALSQRLAGVAANELEEGQLHRALLFAAASYDAAPTNEARRILQRVIRSQPQLRTVLASHSDAVSRVAFSPDGKTLASASEDTTLILWDIGGRRSLGEPLKGHHDAVQSVAFSPDGKTLASASNDKTVILWDVASRKPLGEPLTGHQDSAVTVVFSPDGKTLASASEDNTVMLWDVVSHRSLGGPLRGHQNAVFDVAFSPDGKTLASASGDKTVILWDVTSRTPLGIPLVGHKGGIWSLAFSPDGKTLASGSADKTVILWDVATYKPLGEILKGHTADIRSVAFSRPDGKTVASASEDKTVILWDVANRKPLGEPLKGHGDTVRNVAFSPDDHTLASAGGDGTVMLWDVARKPLDESLGMVEASWMPKACAIANRNLSRKTWAQYVGEDVPYRALCPELPVPPK